MIFFKRFFDFILFGNIYVAFGAVFLIQSTITQLGIKNQLISYSTLTFFATLFIYNLQRVFYKIRNENSLLSIRRKWIYKNQFSIKLLCLTGLSGVAISFFFNDYKILFYLSPLLILSIAYFLPAVKLRENAWFKLLTLSFVWTIATAIVPALLTNSDIFTLKNVLHFFTRMTFMIGICIPFDIRDYEIDKIENVYTLPHIFGENKTRWIAVLFMGIYLLFILLEYQAGMLSGHLFIALLTTASLNSLLVWMSSSKRSEYFYIAGIDGMMIIQGIVLLLVN